MAAGFAIDVSNARQAKEHLNAAAEAAAHAGLVQLAEGGEDSDVRAAALANVERNVSAQRYGNVVASAQDIEIAHFDPETGELTSEGPANAVRVLLRRDAGNANALKTYLLGWIGLDHWDIRSASATALAQTRRCSNTEGIFAHGDIQLRSHNTFGAGICLHSADKITMSNHNEFEVGAYLSMPDLEDCDKCDDDDKNPGVVAAAHEASYLMEDVGQKIAETRASFLGSGNSEIRDDFFALRSLDPDLSPLSDIGIDTAGLQLGDVVSLTGTQFATLPRVPEGLTYDVSCAGAMPGGGSASGSGNGKGQGKGNGGSQGGGDVVTTLDFDNASLTDVAVITDCAISFGSNARILGSLILSTDGSGFHESSGALVGAADDSCAVEDRVTVMVSGDEHAAAKFVANNVTFLIDGDLHLASGGAGTSDHWGVAIHTSGSVDLTTHHDFWSCGHDETPLAPRQFVIRNVAVD